MNQHTKAVLALILLAWIFATMAVFPRYLEDTFLLFQQTYLRIAFAFLLSFLFLLRYSDIKKLKSVPRKDYFVLIFRAISLYLGVLLFTEAILHTKLANASFITVLPLLPIFGYLFFKESLQLKTLVYILVGFFGVALISTAHSATIQFGYGELMAFLSLLAFDLSYVARRWHSNILNNLETTCFMLGVGTAFLFITSLVFHEGIPSAGQFTVFTASILLLSAVFNIANLYLINYGFQHVKVAVAGNIITLETIFALAYGFILFHEVPVFREVIGSLLVLLSVYQVNKLESS